ncbi:MAG: GNAT family N-acetyltransferase [Parabacteroides sp.]|nr:GNAT family N-acetyltransferase [Parabacteroides sp.]
MDTKYNYIIRPIKKEEIYLLRDFLYEAIFIPEGIEPPAKEVVDLPELKVYIEGFGEYKDDYCLIAETKGNIIGAVWCRIMNDYGHVDNSTPSLSISLYKEYRNKGIGSQLMIEMIMLLRNKGYKQVSLSVQKANYAVKMYLKLGFKTIKETEDEFVMVKNII